MIALLAIFLAGMIFALGLGISGMTDADKVIGFLDIADQWDASLAFVMVGAIGVHWVSYRIMARRESPLLAEMFRIPTTQHIDKPLIIGASLFGIGWGLGGYCPGPGIVSGATLGPEALTYVMGMLLGMTAYRFGGRGRTLSTHELPDG